MYTQENKNKKKELKADVIDRFLRILWKKEVEFKLSDK